MPFQELGLKRKKSKLDSLSLKSQRLFSLVIIGNACELPLVTILIKVPSTTTTTAYYELQPFKV